MYARPGTPLPAKKKRGTETGLLMQLKILVIKLGALGDVLMSTPALSSLCLAHKDEHLVLLTSPAFKELFSSWPGLQLKTFPRKGTCAALKTISWIRSQKFDRIYDLQSNDRSRIYCCLSGCREIVGNHNHFPYRLNPGESYHGQCHISEWQKKVLQSAGVPPGADGPCLPESGEERQKVRDWLEKNGLLGKRLVLLHAGASAKRPEKRWPYFEQLGVSLEAAGFRVIWLGAGADVEINRSLCRSAGINASNVFTVNELVELGRRAAFSITNDSGPMHALACAGQPVYALFGPSNWRRNHAIGQQDHVVCLNKSNAVWRAGDYSEDQASRLELISADMLWELLVKEKRIAS